MKTRIAIIATCTGALLCGGILALTATTRALAQNASGGYDALTDGLLGRQALPSTAKSDKRGASQRVIGFEKTFLDGDASVGRAKSPAKNNNRTGKSNSSDPTVSFPVIDDAIFEGTEERRVSGAKGGSIPKR